MEDVHINFLQLEMHQPVAEDHVFAQEDAPTELSLEESACFKGHDNKQKS